MTFSSLSAAFRRLQARLGLGRPGLARKLRRNGVRPDILLPGGIVVDLTGPVLFNLATEVSLRFGEINGIAVDNTGETGFMDNYVLSLETLRHDMPRLEWRISNSRRDAEQVARIIGDVLTGALMTPDNARLPARTRVLAALV